MHPEMQQQILAKRPDETIRTRNFDGMWARLMETPNSLRVTRRPMGFIEASIRALRNARRLGLPLAAIARRLRSDPERIRLLAHFGASLALAEKATVDGDVAHGVQFIGQAQGLVDDIPTASELVERVIAEAEAVLERLR
jgi:enoyl-[acyl-carrier protein] reductase II